MYESITDWRDLEDKHLYHKGDKYPHNGREVSKERIAELCGTQNKAGFAVIKALEAPVEEIPTEAPKAARKGRRAANK